MLFGAGNLMYPLQVGMESGSQYLIGLVGFLMTAVLLPAAGFISMILFNGNYQSFFYRLGRPVGAILLFACILVIGPVIAIPRITTLSHTMVAPFLAGTMLGTINHTSSFIFALIFLTITFLLTFRESRIVTILGYVISPLLLTSLLIIIVKGLLMPGVTPHYTLPWSTVFTTNFMRGYETLDLLGAIFFSSIAITILKTTLEKTIINNPRVLAIIGLQASIIGVSFLALIYIGLCLLGSLHGVGLESVGNQGELFRAISFKILGGGGAFVIATAVLMACLSTSIALSAVTAEYVQSEIFRGKVPYVITLILVLLACLPLSVAGLTTVLGLTGGIIVSVGYPVLIALTLCNIAYKLFGFKPVKTPVAIVFALAVLSVVWPMLHCCCLCSV
jgi:LIVCS family branched-chain amino acid:cation transporter